MRWTEQSLGNGWTVLRVLDEVRTDMRDGVFDFATWDHAAPGRVSGRSNKQIRIVGAILTGDQEISQDQAEAAILHALLGPQGT